MRQCPICGRASPTPLTQHLTREHRVENEEELALLLSIATSRFKGPLRCAICDKEGLCRLDRHLTNTHKVPKGDLTDMLDSAKKARLVRDLAQLRARKPQPPMVSELDLGHGVEPKTATAQAQPSTSKAIRTDLPSPNRSNTSDPSLKVPRLEIPQLKASMASQSHLPSPAGTNGSYGTECPLLERPVKPPPPKGRAPEIPRHITTSIVSPMLDDFMEFYLVSKPTRKDLENASLRKGHAIRFLLHMHRQSRATNFTDLKFMHGFHHMRQWPVDLLSQGYATTSVKVMLLNACSFVKHVKAFFPEESGLSPEQFDQILLQFKRLQKDNSRTVKAHQQTVKWRKSKLLRPSSDLASFMHIASYEVPKLTDKIRRRPQVQRFKLLQGYLAGYLAILTGHRPVVLLNIQKAKVQEAEMDNQDQAVIWVDRHKTDRAFGNAFVALLQREMDWLKGLIQVSTKCFGGEHCPYVFQLNGKQLSKLTHELRTAWTHARLPGHISFGLIRTVVSNQAKKHLREEERRLVCEAMCHDLATADRFYTAVPDSREIFRIRDLRMKAMEQDGLEPSSQSSEDGESGTPSTDDSSGTES